MAEHTPGPWYQNISAKYPVFAGEAPNHVHIASILHGASDSEREANLRLIAAAPDLLYACQILIRLVELEVVGDTPNEVKTARAAIAKAKQS